MCILLIISFSILFLYVIQIGLFTYGFIKLPSFKVNKSNIKYENKRYISIIIPFKNEEKNLSKLIQNLKEQTLESVFFEVILVNDKSNDKSYNIVNKLIKDIPNFYLINNNSEEGGKKRAIQEGIKKSSTNIIITSDADCIHQEKWLETILNYYLEHKPKMIIAPVLMTGSSLFQKLQSLEFLSLTASTAGAAGIKQPIMCNGANLIYEKDTYLELKDGLNMKEVSGDDIFLLHNIKKQYLDDIHYLKSKDAVVFTEAEKSIKSFFKQRIRWASKSKSYKDFDTIISAILVFGINILFIMLLFLAFVDSSFFTYLFLFWIIKFSIDFSFLIIAGKYFKQFPNAIYTFLLSLVYPFYIGITAVVSFFIKTVVWKTK